MKCTAFVFFTLFTLITDVCFAAPRIDIKVVSLLSPRFTRTRSCPPEPMDRKHKLLVQIMKVLGIVLKIVLYREDVKLVKQNTCHLIDELVETAKIATKRSNQVAQYHTSF